MADYDFDLITIGAGSGGVAASRRAAAHGAKVAIIEGGRAGGTCVIRGCVPKKIFMYASQFADAFSEAQAFGWHIDASPQHNISELTENKNRETDRLEMVYRNMLSTSNITVFDAWAKFVDNHHVQVGNRVISAKTILVASGGGTSKPAIEGIELCQDSTSMMECTTLPASLLILGGGYIAVEFASIFANFGSKVQLAYRADLPLRGFDQDLRQRLADAMANRGVKLLASHQPKRISQLGEQFVVEFENGESRTVDSVMNALGRHPNTNGLALEKAGLTTDSKSGAIIVDDNSRTSTAHIFAIGDVTNRVNLTPVAIAEGRAFADSEFGGNPRQIDHNLYASAVFSQPPLASIGITETEANAQDIAITVYESDFRPMKNTFSGSTERTYIKLIVREADNIVIGAHMIGTDAPEIIQAAAIAITMKASKADFDRTIAVHPTSGEELVLMREPRKNK